MRVLATAVIGLVLTGWSPCAPAAEIPPERPGNPLWAIPIETLTATRERPIFSPSRRPPPSTEVAALPPPPPPPAAPSAPVQPPLTLIGTIVNASGGYGIFLDQATNTVMRLKTGEDHDGWILRTVSMRDAMLQKDRSTAVLTLPGHDSGPAPPHPDASAAPPGVRAAGVPNAAAPAESKRPPKPKLVPYPDH
jgi:general secretion pathway protein N